LSNEKKITNEANERKSYITDLLYSASSFVRLFTRTRRVRSLARNSSTWCTTVRLLMSTQWLCTVTNCNILN